MRYASPRLGIMVLRISLVVLILAVGGGVAAADNSPNYVLTQDMLNKTLGALGDLRAKNLPFKIGDGSLETEVAHLQKQRKVESIIKKRGLSVREFVLTYKATAQIREAEKARDDWQRILQDSSTAPQAKLDATEKLAESLKNNLFTPEQTELVRRHMSDLETLLPTPK